MYSKKTQRIIKIIFFLVAGAMILGGLVQGFVFL
jgi:hypothetical protein